MEWMRRALLLLALVLSVGTAQYVSLEPLLYVRPLDLAEEQDDETAWTEEGQRLRALPLLEYIEETTRGILFKADTPEWRVFLENVLAVSRGGAGELSGHPWLFRVSAEDRDLTFYPRRVFFRPDEPPLQILRGRLEKNHDRLVAALDRPEGGSAYFEIVLQTYGDDDFHFGSGFSRRPRPPARFLRPCRKFSLWILLAGLLFYVLLPRPKLDRASIRYAPWRVVLGDVASLLMFLPFFALPFFIVGGTVQTFTQGWIFLLIMWPLAFVGVWLLHDMARSASYEIRLRDDGLELRMLRKAR
ncbi:MAG: hypothetical protein FJY83_11535, partial [Candidatus Aminicenantes bacterium]|nr:hypothetical protein [Candidatus Aminicenantes bacterium]